MSRSFLGSIRKKLAANSVLEQCSENGCSVTSDIQPLLIVKGESVASLSEKVVDCIFFLNYDASNIVVLAELKNSNYHVRAIKEKMDNSVRIAMKLSDGLAERFVRAIFVRKGGHPRVGTAEYVLLAKANVRLRRSGDKLSGLLPY